LPGVNDRSINQAGNIAGVGGVRLEIENDGRLLQPIGFFIYQNQQYEIPLRYAYSSDGRNFDFGSGLEAGIFLFPRINQRGGNMVLESTSKLVLAVLFVFIGWRVYGAILGAILGSVFAIILSFAPLKDIIIAKEKKSKTIGIYKYAKPAFLITFLVITFYSVDLIIAKIVFSEEVAGTYAIASILSKIIFWGTLPISKAMFPLITENSKDMKKSKNIFTNSFILLTVGIVVALIVFYFFSGTIIQIFSGKILLEAAGILFFLGIGTSMISIANLILLHKLSINRTKGYHYL